MSRARHFAWIPVCLVAAGCGGGATVASSTASPSTVALRGTPSGVSPSAESAASSFSCSPVSGGTATSEAQLTDVRSAHHPGFDQITFEFAAPVTGGPLAKLPAYTVVSQPSANFVRDASGQPVLLEGTAGLRIVVHGASGYDNLASVPRQTYTGSTDQRPGLPEIREVAEVGDYERVLSWGVGLASPACFRIGELGSPARLVIEVAAA